MKASTTLYAGPSVIAAVATVVVSAASPLHAGEQSIQMVTTTSSSSTTAARQHACCLPDASCVDVSERRCGVLGGEWEPPGSDPLCTPQACGTRCDIVFGVDAATAFGALQFAVDYSDARGRFVGTGANVECAALVGQFGEFNDDAGSRVLNAAIIHTTGFEGPADVARCGFLAAGPLDVDQFAIAALDASRPDLTPIVDPGVVVRTLGCSGGVTTTTLPTPACGSPVSRTTPPASSDALFVLRVATELADCQSCVCDVNSSGNVTVRDALMVLLAATGSMTLDCPAC